MNQKSVRFLDSYNAAYPFTKWPHIVVPLEGNRVDFLVSFFLFFFVFLLCLWATPSAYGGSQASGRIGAVATGLHQSHSNVGSEPCLQPTPQVKATPDR